MQDVNRQAGEEASSELNESKCILVKSEKEEDKTPEVKGLQKREVITKKEIGHSKDFKTRGLKSSKIIKETNEANERLTEEKSSLKAVEKKLERGEIRKETHHLEKVSKFRVSNVASIIYSLQAKFALRCAICAFD